MASLVYPQCRPYTGPGKVYCLINAIMDDYYHGRISAGTAQSSLIYLIALNKVNHWMSDDAIKRLVYEAVSELPTYKGERLKKSIRKYVYAYA